MLEKCNKLEDVKKRVWFYEFELPDGSKTITDVPPAVLPIHGSRLEKLRQTISSRVPNAHHLTAFDFASHEGFYSIELAKHFKDVRGYEVRPESLEASKLMSDVLCVENVEYRQADLQTMQFDPRQIADFVLLYGLMYHLENPVHTLRLASQMTRKHILIETQVFQYDIAGTIEDGAYNSIRRVEGVFGLAPDYASRREGGSTDIALVPSLNAILFMLRNFGFREIETLPSSDGDYEQFVRGSRVVIYAQK